MGESFNFKRYLAPLALSAALHGGLGYETHRVHEEKKIAAQMKDREQVKDIFLPVSERELIRSTLDAIGVATPEQLQADPARAEKIDLGKFFLQTEFLEQKITAQQAERAWHELELKRRVFQALAEKITDRRVVLQEILNEIADPAITQNPAGHAISKKLYKRGAAQLSSYLLSGASNCYGATRAFIALARDVYPDLQIKLNVFIDHVRPLVVIDDKQYVAETGAVLGEADDEDYAGTAIYENAQLAFLGLFDLTSTARSMETPGSEPSPAIMTTIKNAWRGLFDYENTRGANFPLLVGALPTRAKAYGEIPSEASRYRVSYNFDDADKKDDQEDSGAQQQNNKENDVDETEAEADVRAIIKTALIKERRKMNASTNTPDTKEVAPSTEKETADNETTPGKKEFSSEMLRTGVEAQLRFYAEFAFLNPLTMEDAKKKMMQLLQQVDEAGELKTLEENMQHGADDIERATGVPNPQLSKAYAWIPTVITEYRADALETIAKHAVENAEKFGNVILDDELVPWVQKIGKEKFIIFLGRIRDALKSGDDGSASSKYFKELSVHTDITKIISLEEIIKRLEYVPRIVAAEGEQNVETLARVEAVYGSILYWVDPPPNQNIRKLSSALDRGHVLIEHHNFFKDEHDKSYLETPFIDKKAMRITYLHSKQEEALAGFELDAQNNVNNVFSGYTGIKARSRHHAFINLGFDHDPNRALSDAEALEIVRRTEQLGEPIVYADLTSHLHSLRWLPAATSALKNCKEMDIIGSDEPISLTVIRDSAPALKTLEIIAGEIVDWTFDFNDTAISIINPQSPVDTTAHISDNTYLTFTVNEETVKNIQQWFLATGRNQKPFEMERMSKNSFSLLELASIPYKEIDLSHGPPAIFDQTNKARPGVHIEFNFSKSAGPLIEQYVHALNTLGIRDIIMRGDEAERLTQKKQGQKRMSFKPFVDAGILVRFIPPKDYTFDRELHVVRAGEWEGP